MKPLPWGKAKIRHTTKGLAALSFEAVLQAEIEINGQHGFAVVDMREVETDKPR